MHQSYQQLDIIVDFASDGRRGDINEGIEAVKLAGVVRYAEVVKFAEFVKFAEAGKLSEAMKLVEVNELIGYVTLGEKEVLMLEGELEVGQMGVRGPLGEVKEVVLEGTGCD